MLSYDWKSLCLLGGSWLPTFHQRTANKVTPKILNSAMTPNCLFSLKCTLHCIVMLFQNSFAVVRPLQIFYKAFKHQRECVPILCPLWHKTCVLHHPVCVHSKGGVILQSCCIASVGSERMDEMALENRNKSKSSGRKKELSKHFVRKRKAWGMVTDCAFPPFWQ